MGSLRAYQLTLPSSRCLLDQCRRTDPCRLCEIHLRLRCRTCCLGAGSAGLEQAAVSYVCLVNASSVVATVADLLLLETGSQTRLDSSCLAKWECKLGSD